MQTIKTPFNWVGNKFKHVDVINKIVSEKEYDNVIDFFMGSANLLFNINAKAITYTGNDKIKLIPRVCEELEKNDYSFTISDVDHIIEKFNRFSTKESYYLFRDYWNEKYKNDLFDKDFLLETVLLLKMCSNSMVRFNQKGEFNQGFRGLGKSQEFFGDSMKELCINSLNGMKNTMRDRTYKFVVGDFINLSDSLKTGKNLLILDPPYILQTAEMYGKDWTPDHDRRLFELMISSNNDFVYFNYLERDGVVNEYLMEFIKENNFNYIEINSKALSGQGRADTTSVKEVIITNVSM